MSDHVPDVPVLLSAPVLSQFIDSVSSLLGVAMVCTEDERPEVIDRWRRICNTLECGIVIDPEVAWRWPA